MLASACHALWPKFCGICQIRPIGKSWCALRGPSGPWTAFGLFGVEASRGATTMLDGRPLRKPSGDRGPGCLRAFRRGGANRPSGNGKPFGDPRGTTGNRRREAAQPFRGRHGRTTAFPPSGNIRPSGRALKRSGPPSRNIRKPSGARTGSGGIRRGHWAEPFGAWPGVSCNAASFGALALA